MKVLVVTHVSDMSGANQSLISIISRLKNEVEFVIMANSYDEKFEKTLCDLGVKIIYSKYSWWFAKHRNNRLKSLIRFLLDASYYYINYRIKRNLILDIKNYNFDLIYTNTSTVNIGARVASKLGIPHIWHIREFGKEDFEFIPVVKKKYIYDQMRKASKVIVISKALYTKYKNIVPEENLIVVYNGFKTEDLISASKKKDISQQINVLIAGQVCSGKGQGQAIQAIDRLYDKGYPIKLYIAGDVDHSYLDYYIKTLKNINCVEVLGRVNNLFDIRNNINIELVCSRSEAFGRVTLEAMLHSIAVIGSNSGGTPELIQDGINGMLYENGNIDELVSKLELIINDTQLYDRIVKNAMVYAKKFTIEKTSVEVLRLFKENI